MVDTLDKLHQDHINIARLLDLLESETDEFAAGGNPDYALMTDIVDYVQDYSNLVHHPNEDVIFEHYLSQGGRDSADVEALMSEHRSLVQQVSEFYQLLEQLQSDAIISRAELERKARDFIQVQRAHLNLEEVRVFPMLSQSLSDADWEAIDARLSLRADPVFGEQVEKRFESLFERITSSG